MARKANDETFRARGSHIHFAAIEQPQGLTQGTTIDCTLRLLILTLSSDRMPWDMSLPERLDPEMISPT